MLKKTKQISRRALYNSSAELHNVLCGPVSCLNLCSFSHQKDNTEGVNEVIIGIIRIQSALNFLCQFILFVD
jgi:hypothetical protein